MNLLPLNWSDPKPLNTCNGPRLLRTAPVTETFWALWKSDKVALKAAGYAVSKSNSGHWEVCHWGKDETKEVIDTAAIVASRASDSDFDAPVPEGLSYLPYQRAGIAFGAGRNATLIADEMGLGKTIQAIGIANVIDAERVLIVCPASLRLNWAKELGKWLVTPRTVTVMTSKDAWPVNPQVVVINYDILKKFHSQLRNTAWDLVVFDEAHYCKNPKAQRTAEAFGRAKGRDKAAVAPITGTHRVLLTGTPLKNRPIELFPLLQYLDGETWNHFFRYAKRYCAAHQNGFGWDFSGASNLDELQNRLRSTVMVRRLKQDVLTELPAKQRQVISVPANGSAALVEAEVRAYAEWEAAKASGDTKRLGVAVGELARLRVEVALVKLPDVIERLQDAENKVVVFAHHHEIISKLTEALEGEGVVVLTGKTSLEDRQAAVDKFQSDPSVKYFIGSIGAAGVGITLTAASHVVFAELAWTPGDITQAEDRCHRIGQRDSVLVQHIVLDGSLDDRMLSTIIKKQRVADKTLDIAPEAKVEVELKLPEQLPGDAWKAAEKKVEADRIPQEKVEAVHRAVQIVAGMCDGARELDNMGFNGTDANFGGSLARQESLTQRQAGFALKMMRKYRRQLPADLYGSLYGEKETV